jgi:hypothetical protein
VYSTIPGGGWGALYSKTVEYEKGIISFDTYIEPLLAWHDMIVKQGDRTWVGIAADGLAYPGPVEDDQFFICYTRPGSEPTDYLKELQEWVADNVWLKRNMPSP